jgi:hypothetical protein
MRCDQFGIRTHAEMTLYLHKNQNLFILFQRIKFWVLKPARCQSIFISISYRSAARAFVIICTIFNTVSNESHKTVHQRHLIIYLKTIFENQSPIFYDLIKTLNWWIPIISTNILIKVCAIF